MKLLLLGLVLHFTGVHGKYFWQQDKPHKELSLWKVVEDGAGIVVDAVKHVDYLEIAEKFKLKEKLEAVTGNTEHTEKVLEGYYQEVRKSYEEKIHQNFPVFKEKVYPLLKEFNHNLQELIRKSAKEIWPATSDFVSGLRGEFGKFLTSVSDVAEKSRDRLHVKSESMRTKVEPYAHDVRAEYEKYKKNLKTSQEHKVKLFHGERRKYLDEFRAKMKPLFEELQENVVPYPEELHQNAENMMWKNLTYFSSFGKK